MINRKAKIISSLLLGIITFSGLASGKIFAIKRNSDEAPPKPGMAGVTCYLVGPPPAVLVPKVGEIKDQIKQLDSLYAEAKINTETYNERKKKLQEQLKRIESSEDGIDENSIEDLNRGLMRIRYMYKQKQLTPEMYNDKRKFYMKRIADLKQQQADSVQDNVINKDNNDLKQLDSNK